MKRPIILAFTGVASGAAALALAALPAQADGYARGQIGAPQVRQQTRVHHAPAPRAQITAHRYNAGSGIRGGYGYGRGGANHGHVTGYSHGYTGVGYPLAQVQSHTVVERAHSYSGGQYHGGSGYYGHGYDQGGAAWGRPADQSGYWDYRYRSSTDGVRQGLGRYGGHATAYYGGRGGGYGDGYRYTYDYGDRGGRYGYSEERSYSDYGYGGARQAYEGREYRREDRRWDDRRDDYRQWDDRQGRWSQHQGQDGRRWECNCRETW